MSLRISRSGRRAGSADTQAGFSLIELLVVMIIIGVLAGIAIPTFLSQKSKARDAGARADVTTIAQQLTAYYVDGQAKLVATGTPGGAYSLVADEKTVDTGRLSPGNVIVGNDITNDTNFCVAVQHFTAEAADSKAWSYDESGLHEGNLC